MCDYLNNKKALHLLGFAIYTNNLLLCDKKVSELALDKYQLTLKRVMKIQYLIDRIQKKFCDNKIKHIFLKGAEVRKLYKYPFLRNSSDIDLYVNEQDLLIAKNILIKDLGCKVYLEAKENVHDVSLINKITKIKIELHYCISSFMPNDLKHLLDNPFRNAIKDNDNKYTYHLNKSEEILYFLVHTAKHIRVAQFWYSTIIDYYYLSNNIDIKLITLARLNTFNDCLANYVNYIYHSKKLNINSKLLEEILFIHSSKLSKVINIRKSSKFKYLINRIFVPYSELKNKYIVLNKHPLLFPVLSIYRWITLPFKISSEGKLELEAIKKNNDIIIRNLKSIGLDEYLVNQENNFN